MATDFTKLPKQILIDLINLTNNISLAAPDLVIGPVSKLIGGNRNSAITVTAVPGSGYYGSRNLTYDRVDFALIPGRRSTLFRLDGATRISHIIPLINEAYQINLQPEDYLDGPLSENTLPNSTQRSFMLVAKPESLVWMSSVELFIDGVKDGLGSILGVQNLSGFDFSIGTVLGSTMLSGFELPE